VQRRPSEPTPLSSVSGAAEFVGVKTRSVAKLFRSPGRGPIAQFLLEAGDALENALEVRIRNRQASLAAGLVSARHVAARAPLLRPAIIGGLVMAFALSFDEFVISILLAHGGIGHLQLFKYMRFSVSDSGSDLDGIQFLLHA
jgi:hypothetical protein